MQNTWRRDCLWRGDFWCPFSKRCHFWPISNAVLNFQNIVCKVVRKFVFKPPHSLFSSLLNERFSGLCIQMYFVTIQVKALQKFYELSTPTTVVDFLKWLCCGCCFENVTLIIFHYSICTCLQPPDIDIIFVFAKRVEGLSKWTFLKINKFYNTIPQKLTFSANQKLTSSN